MVYDVVCSVGSSFSRPSIECHLQLGGHKLVGEIARAGGDSLDGKEGEGRHVKPFEDHAAAAIPDNI